MRATRLSTILRALGLTVGLAAGAALLLGFDTTRISPFLIKVAIFKLSFIAALALLAAGAMLGRRAKARTSDTVTTD